MSGRIHASWASASYRRSVSAGGPTPGHWTPLGEMETAENRHFAGHGQREEKEPRRHLPGVVLRFLAIQWLGASVDDEVRRRGCAVLCSILAGWRVHDCLYAYSIEDTAAYYQTNSSGIHTQ